MKIPRHLWIRWFMWFAIFAVCVVGISLIESRMFMLEAILIIVIIVLAAVVFNYEESVLVKYLEANRKCKPRITEEQFNTAIDLLLEEGGFVVDKDADEVTITGLNDTHIKDVRDILDNIDAKSTIKRDEGRDK